MLLAKFAVKRAFILATITGKKISKTKASFLAFRVVDTGICNVFFDYNFNKLPSLGIFNANLHCNFYCRYLEY